MSDFLQKYRGFLSGIMQWHDLDRLWQVIRQQNDGGWFVYQVGEAVPEVCVATDKLDQFIRSIDELLHREHEHDYCGIVYVDDVQSPELVKIYDPNNLGVSCGFSDNPPLPGWVLSRIKPVDLEAAFPPPASRKRWWKRIFS